MVWLMTALSLFHPHLKLRKLSQPAYRLTMQMAVVIGFVASYSMNRWVIKNGLKEAMSGKRCGGVQSVTHRSARRPTCDWSTALQRSEGRKEKDRKARGDTALKRTGLKLHFFLSLPCLAALTFGAGSAVAQGTALVGNKAQDANTVTIISTQYGVLPEYRITVSSSGQIMSTMQPRHRRKAIVREDQMTVYNRQQFFHHLTRASPLNALPIRTGRRPTAGRPGRRSSTMAPVTAVNLPGPQIYVQYHRQQTPNLRMASSSTGKLLYADVTKIMEVLRMPIPDYP